MINQQVWLEKQARLCLQRIRPRVDALFVEAAALAVFCNRLDDQFPRLFRLLFSLYGTQYDFYYHLEQTILAAAQAFIERSDALKSLDAVREADPLWFQGEHMVGGVCYVDLFAGDLSGLRAKTPYFRELGLTYLHLMPLFRVPADNNDGGYAVSSYREVEPALGTMSDLSDLAQDLRDQGISLVLDFVFNHTSDEHRWAKQALAGDEHFQAFYLMFDDRTLPDQYEAHLREIFPEQDPGSFTYRPEIGKWVWTTFRHFQWDLNYANPAVFRAMMEEMLFLANQGVEVLRLDAVAFIWKQLGTSCENLPQAHWIIQALNALVRITAPAMIFKSEAIVHPDYVASYIDWQECPLSYNPTLMNLLWEALATRETRLLHHSMVKRFAVPERCAWVNYVRSHDDIGWSFADEDAVELGINGFDHRQFLNRFYTGRFEGSFASGLPFNYNPYNQDMRISGTAASLAGLEQALSNDHAGQREYAIRRILLIHSVILSIGGIPLFYLGDELATINNYDYQRHPAKSVDSRWAHRPPFDWGRARQRHDHSTVVGRVFQTLQHLVRVRQETPAFANGQTTFVETGNSHVFAYVRRGQVLVLTNFAEQEQSIPRGRLQDAWPSISGPVIDLSAGSRLDDEQAVILPPYAFMWLAAVSPP